MKNTTISILVAIVLFGVIAAIVFIDEGPPRIDFQEIVAEEVLDEDEVGSTTSENEQPVEEEKEAEGVVDKGPDVSTVVSDESVPDEGVPAVEEESDVQDSEIQPDATNTDGDIAPGEESTSTSEQVGATEEDAGPAPEDEVVDPVVEEEPVTITPPSDFVLHMLFDETEGVRASDSTGHGNYGTLVNADTLIAWNGGQVNGGLFLDGQNDYLGVAHSETLNLGEPSQSYTISFWFRSTDEPGSEVQIIGKGGRSGPSPFSIRLNRDGEPSLRVSDGVEATTLQLSNSVTNGSWKHITAIRDGSTKRLRMYIDGIEYGGLVYDTSTKSLTNNSAILLNRYEAGLNEYRYHNFGIDDLRIYNRALSNQEILEVVNEGRI